MDDQDEGATSVASSSKLPPSPPHTHRQAGPQHSDVSERSDLLERARFFLASPQVRHEDVSAKRRFLVDKGLSETEIITLLQELVCVFYARPNQCAAMFRTAIPSASRTATDISSTTAFQPSEPTCWSVQDTYMDSWRIHRAPSRLLRAFQISFRFLVTECTHSALPTSSTHEIVSGSTLNHCTPERSLV